MIAPLARAAGGPRPGGAVDPATVTVCCGFGDPWSPYTWSGTPLNLCSVLQSSGRLGRAIDGRSVGGVIRRRVLNARSYLRYGGDAQHDRGRVLTSARAERVARLLGEHPGDLLHLGIDHLPLPRASRGGRSYLYIDSTPGAVRANSRGAGWQNARLLRDIEEQAGAAMAQMDHIFTISRHMKEQIAREYGCDPSRITAVGTGRGPIRPDTSPRRYDGRTLLFVAKREFEDKGGALLLEAFSRAKRKDPGLRLVIAGQQNYPDLYGGLPGVTAHGRITLEKLQELFQQADLFAMPALYEPWGLVYLEAMSCRVPVLGLRRQALPEITDEGRLGFLCAEPEPSLLAEVILDAMSDAERLRRMGVAAQERCLEHYTWEKTVERMLAVMRRGAARVEGPDADE